MNHILYTDGGARGNPGPAGAGFALYSGNTIAEKGSKFLGRKTNNEAEYLGLILGLKKAVELGWFELEVRMDSELIIKQMRGEYKVKNKNLLQLFAQALAFTNKFKNICFKHVAREKNSIADALVNAVLDHEIKKQ